MDWVIRGAPTDWLKRGAPTDWVSGGCIKTSTE